MPKINIGLRFPGTCEEAFKFYRSVFLSEYLDFIRIGDDPYTKANSPEEDHGKMAYVALQIGNVIIGGDDAPGSAKMQPVPGNILSVSIEPDSKIEADRLFKGLSLGGKVSMEMTDYPWGYIGSVTDRFGVNWGVWYIPPKK
jgi:PhnB protein